VYFHAPYKLSLLSFKIGKVTKGEKLMKQILAIIMFIISINTYSNVRVMTFNTTCSYLCEKGNFDKFKYRKSWIVDTVKRANPDLIGFQEVFTSRQLNWFKKELKDYHLMYFRKYYIFRFADPALFVKKSRFSINKWGGFWLGPRGYRFSLGWKKRLPRRLQWARLLDNQTGKQFYFASSHFDNDKKNKTPSAKVFTDAFKDVNYPVIFAADTNLKPEMEGYKHITQTYYDSYDITQNFEMVRNSNTNEDDSCNLEKGKTFPSCRVDHIFLSKKNNWRVHNWAVDQFKYGKNNRFTSDHRALYADIEFL
jgi:endonuclease/exonuclease/phosphatase family metal-dependent hydrolase